MMENTSFLVMSNIVLYASVIAEAAHRAQKELVLAVNCEDLVLNGVSRDGSRPDWLTFEFRLGLDGDDFDVVSVPINEGLCHAVEIASRDRHLEAEAFKRILRNSGSTNGGPHSIPAHCLPTRGDFPSYDDSHPLPSGYGPAFPGDDGEGR